MDINNLWSDIDLSKYKQNTRCLAINTILAGKYLVGPVLGQGGFGITYLGYDLNMETKIAIKEYFPVELVSRDTTTMHGDRVLSLSGEKSITYQQGLKKYVAEAQNVSQFSEVPGVVSVKDFFYENETAYIVMEYIDGISLKDYLKECSGRLSEEETLAIMKPVLEALEKVHNAGIIHRDISPDNIMITFENGKNSKTDQNGKFTDSEEHNTACSQGENPSTSHRIKSVKLIDFGAARMTAKNDQKSLTIILKHGYAPEEQYRTHGEQGPWTDVYALCAVMYRMLTGATPVPAMDRMFKDELKSFEELGLTGKKETSAVSTDTADAILKGLAVKKDDRIQNIRELIDVLYGGKTVKKNILNKRRNKYSMDKNNLNRRRILIGAGIGLVAVILISLIFGVGFIRSRMNSDSRLNASDYDNGMVNNESDTDNNNSVENSDLNVPSGEGGISGNGSDSGEVVLDNTPVQKEEIIAREEILNNGHKDRMLDGSSTKILVHEDGTVTVQGTNENMVNEIKDWSGICSVAGGDDFCLGLRTDGSVAVVDNSSYGISNAEQWKDVISIAASSYHAVGLCLDGTVVSVGDNRRGQCDVSSWNDMQAVAATGYITVGVKKDGAVLLIGKEQAVSRGEKEEVTGERIVGEGWTDIVQLELAANYIFGLKKDGTVLCINIGGDVYEERLQKCAEAVSSWKNIVSICDVSNLHPNLVGVDSDGKLHTYNGSGALHLMEEHIFEWDDIEEVEGFSFWRLLGRKEDGTYISTPNTTDSNSPREMKNIITAGSYSSAVLALDENGSILYNGIRNAAMFENEVINSWPKLKELSVSVYVDLHISGIDEDGNCYFFCGDGNIRKSNKKAVQVTDGNSHRAILYEDGTVEAWGYSDQIDTDDITGKTESGSCDVEKWKNVQSVTAAGHCTLGLTDKGTILAAGQYPQEILEWKDIVFLTADARNCESVGAIDRNGKVWLYTDSDEFGQANISGWDQQVVSLAVSPTHTVGLCEDGTVKAVGNNASGQCEVADWTDIKYIYACENLTLGITESGELKIAGLVDEDEWIIP